MVNEKHTAKGTRTFCRKTLCRTDILPNGHFADGHLVERTFCRTVSMTSGLFAEKTFCRNDNLPKIEKF